MKTIFRTLHYWLICLRYKFVQSRDKEMCSYLQKLEIMSSEETVQYILNHKCSCSRFGDGEFAVMDGGHNGFQRPDAKLGERLKEVMMSANPNLLVCIPRTLKHFSDYTINSQLFAYGYRMLFMKSVVMRHVPTSRYYGDSLFTRFYMPMKDKRASKIARAVSQLKQLWHGQDLLIVEGKYSRLGEGNDLFNNAKSIHRILCPNKNAFDRYDDILAKTLTEANGRLVILALGMTATVLAYDLANKGIQALDLGHVDVEYEWARMGVKEKVAIPGKHVNEAANGDAFSEVDDREYLSQIIADLS